MEIKTFKKRSIKNIGIILLILANIALIIALVSSIRNAISKIEVGKKIDVNQQQEEIPEETIIQGNEDNLLEIEDEQLEYEEQEQTKIESISLKKLIAGINNKNTSIMEIVLVILGIALFIMGIFIIRLVKRNELIKM